MTGTTTPTPSNPPWLLREREPLRVYLHTVAVVIAAGLVLFGVITDEVAEFIGAAAAQLLLVSGAAEVTRLKVYSEPTVNLAAARAAREVLGQTGSVEAAAMVRDTFRGRHAA